MARTEITNFPIGGVKYMLLNEINGGIYSLFNKLGFILDKDGNIIYPKLFFRGVKNRLIFNPDFSDNDNLPPNPRG